MRNTKIEISNNGAVYVPRNVKMNITDITKLFEILYQTTKKNIRSVGICMRDQSMSGTVEGAIFRKWIIDKSTKPEVTTIPLLLMQNAMLN